MRRSHPELFQKPRVIMTLADGLNFWGIGNAFLLAHPCRMQVQISRRETEAQWEARQAVLDEALVHGCVFVSPFISPHEQRVLRAVAARGGAERTRDPADA